MASFKTYYALTKPGIIYGNAITAVAGFLLAAGGHIDLSLFLAMLIGLSLIIACAGVFNNYIDRAIDAKMNRTKKRALASQAIMGLMALPYGAILGLAGGLVLVRYTNILATLVALAGLFTYIVLYSFFKRRSVQGTVVGSLAGAMPPVVGYVSVTNRLDGAALLLFLMLILWQMPHFYAIAIRRIDDYRAAGLPVLPIKKSIHLAKIQILIYILAFTIVALMLSIFGYTGYTFGLTAALVGLYWLRLAYYGFRVSDDQRWARQMFLFSLIAILAVSITISLNAWLP